MEVFYPLRTPCALSCRFKSKKDRVRLQVSGQVERDATAIPIALVLVVLIKSSHPFTLFDSLYLTGRGDGSVVRAVDRRGSYRPPVALPLLQSGLR